MIIIIEGSYSQPQSGGNLFGDKFNEYTAKAKQKKKNRNKWKKIKKKKLAIWKFSIV